MRNLAVVLLGLTTASALAIALAPSAHAGPVRSSAPSPTPAAQPADTGDDFPNPLEAKRRALRQKALDGVLDGTIKPIRRYGSLVARVGRTATAKPAGKSLKAAPAEDQYVELSREKTDKIFVILTEFGNVRHPEFPDKDLNPTIPGPSTFEGPLHNKIPEPDRTKDNTTIWHSDFSHEYFQNLYFGTGPGVDSVKSYFEKQSSGRYSVDGIVTDWVKVKYNEARYGRSSDPIAAGRPGDDPAVCANSNCGNVHFLIRDAIDKWVADQKAGGMTDAQIKAELASFDQWDRYDHDRDGNFNEPDGYIDHFQIVHAGGDQADGDPQQGEDAIWSHRWYAFGQDTGKTGPVGNKLGGTAIGDTGLWVGDYTIQPENGGLSVFVHEYTHDLGEPDYYDTTGAGDNPVEHWSLMAQSRLGDKDDSGIGERPGDLGAREKFDLGWLDYTIASSAEKRTIDLGPYEYNTTKPQAVIVPLPKKTVVRELTKPFAGANEWWSGSGDSLTHTLTRELTLPAGTAELTFQANWDIEDCGADACDYAYVEVDDGTGFKAVHGSITHPTEGDGIDGLSAGWVPATFDLSAYAGKAIKLRFRYTTDGGVAKDGLFVDAVTITANGTAILTDGAESGTDGWTADGFSIITGTVTNQFAHRYIATHRTYVSWDRYLQYGPYNFGWVIPGKPAESKPDWVEHYPYQQGLLIWYVDESQPDNNVSVHPGQGMALVIDSRPDTLYRLDDAVPLRTRYQIYDAPFGLTPAPKFHLHFAGKDQLIYPADPESTFNDKKNYFDPELPDHGVKLPAAGVKIAVVREDGTSATVRVGPAR